MPEDLQGFRHSSDGGANLSLGRFFGTSDQAGSPGPFVLATDWSIGAITCHLTVSLSTAWSQGRFFGVNFERFNGMSNLLKVSVTLARFLTKIAQNI